MALLTTNHRDLVPVRRLLAAITPPLRDTHPSRLFTDRTTLRDFIRDSQEVTPLRDFIRDPTTRDLIRDPHFRDFLRDQPIRDLLRDHPIRKVLREMTFRDFLRDLPIRELIRDFKIREIFREMKIRDFLRDPRIRDFLRDPQLRDLPRDPRIRDFIRDLQMTVILRVLTRAHHDQRVIRMFHLKLHPFDKFLLLLLLVRKEKKSYATYVVNQVTFAVIVLNIDPPLRPVLLLLRVDPDMALQAIPPLLLNTRNLTDLALVHR